MRKALGSNPVSSRRLGFIGDQKTPVIQGDQAVPDAPVIRYDRVTLLIRPDLAEWLRRRKYWERVDMTDDIEAALLAFKATIKVEYEPVPAKKKGRAS